jgi:hypothetical protein
VNNALFLYYTIKGVRLYAVKWLLLLCLETLEQKPFFPFFPFFFFVTQPLFYSLFISSFDYIKKKASKLIAHPHMSSFDIVIFHSNIHSASNPKTKQNIF